MKIRNMIAFATMAALAFPAVASQEPDDQGPPPPLLISVDANAHDVREVLHRIFVQAEKSFVVEVGLYFRLYLNLKDVEFGRAIDIICRNVGMDYTIEDGIYTFFRPRNAGAQVVNSQAARPQTGQLDPAVLNKLLTTRLDQADIRTVAQELTRQTSLPIEVGPEVRALKVNATLLNTSLRFALNSITQAAKLVYTFTNHGTILISDPAASPITTQTQTTNQAAAAAIACDQCKTTVQKGWIYCPTCGNYVKNLTEQN